MTPSVILLAGGLGTRLQNVVSDRPKGLALVNGRPFLSYLLEQLRRAGFRAATISIGFRAEQIVAAFGDSHRGISLSYVREEEPLGTGGAVRLGALSLSSETLLILNGDSYLDTDLKGFCDFAVASGFSRLLAAAKVPDAARFGTVSFDATGRLTSFREKTGIAAPGWINAGIYLMPRTALAAIDRQGAFSLEGDIFPAWIGQDFGAKPIEGSFIDIGTPKSFRRAGEFFAGFEMA